MMTQTKKGRKIAEFLTVMAGYILLEFCEDKVFQYETFFRGLFIYSTLLAGSAVIISSMILCIEVTYMKAMDRRQKEDRFEKKRSEITCVITNQQAYEKRYDEEQLKRKNRADQRIDVII